ncbi:hypothetical protein GQ44DRAFT_763769 [Phaeosphaeriaceae sp. PMI808]|nr:hypothetical protein GQ44DRAFT_763769 [Phaeosphaeriaceae sp. PMI808]
MKTPLVLLAGIAVASAFPFHIPFWESDPPPPTWWTPTPTPTPTPSGSPSYPTHHPTVPRPKVCKKICTNTPLNTCGHGWVSVWTGKCWTCCKLPTGNSDHRHMGSENKVDW